MKISELKRHKAVRTIRFFYNQRQVQATIDLKNNLSSKWLLAKTVQLTHPQQTDVKIDPVIPIVACNLMVEYVDFFETSSPPTASESTSGSTTLQCPRCNSAVAASPGICPNCGENVFQCHKCRSINYDERDPFLCNSCGYCKSCKFNYVFTCKQVNSVEPIENDEDRTKTIQQIQHLMDKSDQIYQQLNNQKPIIEYLLNEFHAEDASSLPVAISAAPVPAPEASNATSTDAPPTPQAAPQPVVTQGGMNRWIQQIVTKYNVECW